jgi:Tfp pilus assembly protein PilX
VAMAQSPRQRQRGSALIVALILLVVAALLGIGAVQAGMMGTRIGRNAQLTQQAQLAAQRAIDSTLSNLATFTDASTAPATSVQSIDIDGDGTADFSVTLNRPACVAIANAKDYSYLTNPPKDTTWVLRAVATEINGNASAEVTQGIRVRLPTSADCPT